MTRIMILLVWTLVLLPTMGWPMRADSVESSDPASTIRALVRANADKDMTTLSRLMAHDADIVSYTIEGRKYVGWADLERDFHEEFSAVDRLELPIRELHVWNKGDVAWFTMELDYIRFFHESTNPRKMVMQLRETGVLERRAGEWVLLSWHESQRTTPLVSPTAHQAGGSAGHHLVSTSSEGAPPDLSGEWDILEVDNDKHYKATLDKAGNGPYTQHGGRFMTTKVADRLWQGTWQQPGNDREGGFELLLSEDGMQAKGIWWYSRVGTQKNIPAREHGGTYQWKRLTSPTTTP